MFKFIAQKGITIDYPNPLLSIIAGLSIYIMIIPIVILDVFLWQYQLIYFSILKIPKIKRDKYVIVDRHKLGKLSWFQKLNCIYCGYVNGMTAYAKAVANQTEIYSCAIKHESKAGGQEHQREFFEYIDYEEVLS